MFKFIALLCLVSAAQAGIIGTSVVHEPVLTKVGSVVHSAPSAVSHQSITQVHSKSVVEPVLAPVLKTTVHEQHVLPVHTVHSGPAVHTVHHGVPAVHTVHHAAPAVHTVHHAAPSVHTVHHAAPVVHSVHSAPVLHSVHSGSVVHSVHSAPLLHSVEHHSPLVYTTHH